MPYLHIHNIDLHYEVVGEGYPFIFLHGLGNDCSQTMEMYKPRENIQCIYPEQKGHGLSSCDDHITFDDFTNDIIALADHLGLQEFILGGQIHLGTSQTMFARVEAHRDEATSVEVTKSWNRSAGTQSRSGMTPKPVLFS